MSDDRIKIEKVEIEERPDTRLAEELAETASTLARLGVTLAALPLAMLPHEQRTRAKQVSSEVLRMAAIIPRAVGAMMEEVADEWQGGEKREDLGSRLRRERRRQEKEERRMQRAQEEVADAERESGAGEEKATEQVQEDIQEAWETTGTDEKAER